MSPRGPPDRLGRRDGWGTMAENTVRFAEDLRGDSIHASRGTLANASFTAGAPRAQGDGALQRFASLLKKYPGDTAFARMLAKATFPGAGSHEGRGTVRGRLQRRRGTSCPRTAWIR